MKNEYRTVNRNGQRYVHLIIDSRVYGKVEVKMDYDLFYDSKVAGVQYWTVYTDRYGRKYARADKKNKQILLHKRLFKVPRGQKIVFKNGNPLDCRRVNLQLIDSGGKITEMYVPDADEEVAAPKSKSKSKSKSKPKPKQRNVRNNKRPLALEEPKTLKGVTFHKASKRWNSRPYWEGIRYSLGYFQSQEEAEAETRLFIREGPYSPRLKRNRKNKRGGP